ncbi:hypothetical protein GOODEAATRI_034530, partial [Goodea atripinnis]
LYWLPVGQRSFPEEGGSMPLWIIVVFQLAGAAKFFRTFCLDFGAAGPDRARGPGWTVGLELERFCCRSLRTGKPWWGE